ncbi:MAG: hypothetical protein M5U26_08470 [Planctomycetota bacterium]|nr:hypothetical protein [Planctomycetota bacterium]
MNGSLLIAYMEACVRLHARDSGRIRFWSDAELLAAFHALAEPVPSFEAWCAKMGLHGGGGAEAPGGEPDDEAKLAANEAGMQALLLAGAKGAPVKVEDPEAPPEQIAASEPPECHGPAQPPRASKPRKPKYEPPPIFKPE